MNVGHPTDDNGLRELSRRQLQPAAKKKSTNGRPSQATMLILRLPDYPEHSADRWTAIRSARPDNPALLVTNANMAVAGKSLAPLNLAVMFCPTHCFVMRNRVVSQFRSEHVGKVGVAAD